MSEETQVAAILAALTAADAHPYDLDELPKALPAYYNEVGVTRRFGGAFRADSRTGTVGYRIAVRAVAKTVSNAREMRSRAGTALDGVVLTIDGRQTTPIRFESAEDIGPDDGMFSGLTLYTYVI